MTTKPRTIDHLGIETSSRYAKDQVTVDPKLIEESKFIPLKIEVSVVKPYLPTEFEEYLLPHQLTLWASFAPPPDYFAYAKPLFTYQLIPSLGSDEKQEANADKLEALEDALHRSFDQKNKGQGEQQQEEKERKTLLALLKLIGKFDRALNLINARRNQYQRG